MLDRIIYYSIHNKLVVALLTLALVVGGGYALTQLPIDAVPDITNNQVQIITRSPSLAPPEVERLITFPVEMALATIPHRVEIRSISRFGLSVVTIVFEEDVDVYWARQQVAERLKEAETLIPAGVGKPELAPVTTGLGEIYQYVLHVRPDKQAAYSAHDLRSMQDWVVRRQLIGTEGVADVSSFGGRLKQYEIALDPDRLRAMNVSISEVFTALERNNQNAGGAYIDKHPHAYFIRNEGLARSLDDLENIVVKTPSASAPVLIRDVGTVQFGSAIRYGALTRTTPEEEHGTESVGGIVLMLKGENSSKVIARVKERIQTIQASLPEGVEIIPFLDRTRLVNSAISTVVTNLAEGALIVIFVLVLFLGNLRAGLVVASAIPLALLFAIALMNAFGVSGNLMSLGAIDFGIIVDGAVIIVEATLHHLRSRVARGGLLSQAEADAEVYHSASRIRSSAAFGEIIILIVYVPILALVGIEGKMFRPMAQTVAFAILGAFILSLTYIPMMSALFLSNMQFRENTFSDRMMAALERYYAPILAWSLRRRATVLTLSAALFVGAAALFFSLGGEFIPTLDEGDFAVETRVMTGSSLSHTLAMSLKASDILVRDFPEVLQVVSKIGNSEIPTDPMPMESCDLMIILKPRREWTSAHSREELAEKMQARLEALPGVEFGFQQPIQMRFNELMTGARQDVVIKIFGENMSILADRAAAIGALLQRISGVEDVYVERVAGLPQIVVRPDRTALARYGVAVEDINRTVRMAFAGEVAGQMYEQEQRYDLVVRLDTTHRREIEDVRRLPVAAPSGVLVPLSELADIAFEQGPNQIQRDNAHRRIVVGFNVRNRDVESVLAEAQSRINASVALPTGYFVQYGGSFENLTHAKQRLQIAVPIALLLIFTLLYFTFGSVKYGLLIFTAIPLSAIGGVIALFLRGMPFSISAGIGFIALFGVAVLNGIVLIAYFNHLKEDGMNDVHEIVRVGTSVRLRPVLMTAFVASLGFLPMALSTSSGAEVQKPLATVVIGGLVSATALTLIVLPILYILVEQKNIRPRRWLRNAWLRVVSRNGASAHKEHLEKNNTNTDAARSIIWLMLVGVGSNILMGNHEAYAQDRGNRAVQAHSRRFTLEQACAFAEEHNPRLKAERINIEMQRALQGTATDIGKTFALLMLGQYNSFASDNNITLTQNIPFPSVFTSSFALGGAQRHAAELQLRSLRNELLFAVKSVFYHIAVLQEREALLREQDSILRQFASAAQIRYQAGESTHLDASTAALQASETALALRQTSADILTAIAQLQALLAIEQPPAIEPPTPSKRRLVLPSDTNVLAHNPTLALVRQRIAIASATRELEAARILPEFSIGYFNQTLIGITEGGRVAGENDRFTGLQIGISLPLWIAPHLARLEAASHSAEIARLNAEAARIELAGDYQQAVQQYLKFADALEYYERQALPQAAQIQANADILFRRGGIGALDYAQTLARVLTVKTNYTDALARYNTAVLRLEFLLGAE